MTAHRWANTGIVNNGARRAEDKYAVYRCTICEQELWHYYDISISPLQAAEIEGVADTCEVGNVRLVTHRQAQRYLARGTIDDDGLYPGAAVLVLLDFTLPVASAQDHYQTTVVGDRPDTALPDGAGEWGSLYPSIGTYMARPQPAPS